MPGGANALSAGKPMSNAAKAVNDAQATLREIGVANAVVDFVKGRRQSQSPAMPPPTIAAIWVTGETMSREISATTAAMLALCRSGHSVRAMLHTACAMIA